MTVRKFLLCVFMLCFSLSFAGCDFLTDKDDGKTKVEKEKITFKVYRPSQDGEWLVAETHENELAKGAQPLQVALATLIDQPPTDEKLVRIFPEKVKLLGVKLKGDIAEVDLSKDVLQSNIGGSLNELMLVTSIVNTATEFQEVKKVQLLVEGKKVETIAGHMDILDPLHRNESIIKKD